MIETQLNIFDSIVLGILLLSSLLGFFRGFIREVLSLGAWLGAALITLYFFADATAAAKQLFKAHIKKPESLDMLSAGAGGIGLYIFALLSISIVNAIVIRYVKTGSEVGVIDNLLGLLFGVVRAAFIISLGFLILTFTMGKEDYPEWLKKSKTLEPVEVGALHLAKMAPRYLSELSTLTGKLKGEEEEKSGEEETEHKEGDGYKSENRKELDRLIEANQPKNAEYPK